MSSAVAYYNRGTRCYVRLATSLFSLRRHYQGTVRLFQEGALEPEMATLLRRFAVDIVEIPQSHEHPLVVKASLGRHLMDEHTIYLDSDTIVQAPLDEFFELIRKHDYVTTWFNKWSTTHDRMPYRIWNWKKVDRALIPPAIEYGKAINTGVQGWTRGSKILEAYETLTRRGAEAGCWHVVLDEIAMQLLIPHHQHYLADGIWNESGEFGDVDQARIVHYHGSKHCRVENQRCDLWKRRYFELLDEFPEHRAFLEQSWEDQRLADFQRNISERRSDLTVVTAVNPEYAEQLKENLPRWLKLPGLRNQQFLVLVNGFRNASEIAFLHHPNVQVEEWVYPFPDASTRERMLAAFVFGAARHVHTPYWMKLDADCTPLRSWWEWPAYAEHDITSQYWTFTKMKGDDSERHWFNRLDDVFLPGTPFFSETFAPGEDGWMDHKPGNQHGLPVRFNSFCHIEKTAHTWRMAERLWDNNGGRLAIPSQDTTSWYCSLIWDKKVKRMNMRRWFQN